MAVIADETLKPNKAGAICKIEALARDVQLN